MDGSDGITSIKADTVEFSTDYMANFTLRLTNNMTADTACKFAAPVNVSAHKVQVTGEIGLYVTDTDFYDKILNNTALEFEVIIGDGTNTFTINLPKLKLGDGQINGTGSNQTIIQPLSFRAVYDSTDATVLTITRSS